MNLKKKLDRLPAGIRKLINAVTFCAEKGNFRVYLVGGIVRDLILGRANLDLDIVVEDDAIKFAKLLSEYLGADFRRHHAFRTATVFSSPYKIDLATSRKEVYHRWGALPCVEPSCLRDDLRRRDFAINAIALSLNRDNFAGIIDYFNGVTDLKKGFIRILHGSSFLDDPTRLFRGIRFKERFGFKFDSKTSARFRQAVKLGALSFVNEHRLRDELILILQEKGPVKYIKALDRNMGLGFLGISKLNRPTLLLLARIERAVTWFNRQFPFHRKLDDWIIYFMGITGKLTSKKLKPILSKFGFKKGDRVRILASRRIKLIDKLSCAATPSRVYRLLRPLSFETIVFLYAFSSSRSARRNIEEFLAKSSRVKLKIKGGTLKELGIYPRTSYGKILKRILYKKIDGKILNKKDEIEEAKRIHHRAVRR